MAEDTVSKPFWKSKTAWFNVLSAAATIVGVVPIPPEVAVYVVSGINLGLRVLTKGPIYVLKDAATEP